MKNMENKTALILPPCLSWRTFPVEQGRYNQERTQGHDCEGHTDKEEKDMLLLSYVGG